MPLKSQWESITHPIDCLKWKTTKQNFSYTAGGDVISTTILQNR